MARAAVKAKQQARAKAQPQKARPHGRRRHAGGGNPNQDLFFVRLRRHQKWVYALLAVVFGLSFILVGVGSGNGGGLQQLWNGIFGGSGGSSISQAQDEVNKDPVKGYPQLANAYESKGDTAGAIGALTSYLALKKKDAATWAELGGLELSQGTTYATQYQSAQQAAQQADPSAAFLPGGTLGSAVGVNPAYQGASQAASSQTSLLYRNATSAFAAAVKDYQKASQLRPHNAAYYQELASAAANAGNNAVAVKAWKDYLREYPNAPLKSRIEKEIKALSPGAAPTVKSGNGH